MYSQFNYGTVCQFGSSAQPFKTVKDYENWLSRLEKYHVWLQAAEQRMKQGIKEGYVLSSALIKKIIPQFETLATTPLETHLFYAPIKKLPAQFLDDEKKALTASYTQILNEKLIPSFTSIHQFLKTDYTEAGRKDSGINGIPQGENTTNML